MNITLNFYIRFVIVVLEKRTMSTFKMHTDLFGQLSEISALNINVVDTTAVCNISSYIAVLI